MPEQPPQEQEPPGVTSEMTPRPKDEMRDYEGRGLLAGKRALVAGGDSGIGRAVAVAFAKEGADVAVAYLEEHSDAEHTKALVEAQGRRCVLLPGDLAEESRCVSIVEETVAEFGGLDTLVLHHGTQAPQDDLTKISTEQWDRTMRVNVTSFFWIARAALEHLPESDASSITMTGSVNGLRGNAGMIDYSVTKGAIHIFVKSLAQSLADRGIRVNCVAPGPVWTPLIPATIPAEKVESFGGQSKLGRAAEPDEIAPSYVFLASERMSSFYTGQVFAAVGGETHPG